MKWTNKGHQFDRFSEIFSNEMKVYIYGAGENGKDLFSRMMFADCVEAFIDNDERKESYHFMNLYQRKKRNILLLLLNH